MEDLVTGMRQLGNKNIVVDYQDKKVTWQELGIPEDIVNGLSDKKMDKPSIIQAASYPRIMEHRDKDYLFQAANGSGKTLAFGIPAIMSVDPEVEKVQVIIVANTRELIRQVQAVIAVVAKNTKVTCCIGDTNTSDKLAHILVTVPKWLENRVSGRTPIDFSQVKLVAFDEADEIFLHE
jgi:superfamily II DNA/RNA helicase